MTVSGNTVTGGSLLMVIGMTRRANIVFTNNSSTVPRPDGSSASPIDGLTVTGNVQPLTSGALANTTDCTGVTTQ